MQASLELSGHPKANVQRVILSDTTLIGRSRECGLQIASSSVSRKHCEIRLNGEALSVIDLGSSNGTYIGSERLPPGEERPLPSGSRLNVGGVRFLVQYAPASIESESAPSPETTGAGSVLSDAESGEVALAVDEPILSDEPLQLGDDAAGDSAALSDEVELSEEATLPEEQSPAESDKPLVAEEALLSDEDVPLVVDDDVPLAADEESSVAVKSAVVDEESLAAVEESAVDDDSAIAEDSAIDEGSADDEILLDPLAEPDVMSYFDDEPSAEASRDDASDDSMPVAAESEDADDEPILEADEDQAFAFLTDDEDEEPAGAKSDKQASDNELRDFLGQLGRD